MPIDKNLAKSIYNQITEKPNGLIHQFIANKLSVDEINNLLSIIEQIRGDSEELSKNGYLALTIRRIQGKLATLDRIPKILEQPPPSSRMIEKRHKCPSLKYPKNDGRNSCYMDSILWALFHSNNNPFYKKLLESGENLKFSRDNSIEKCRDLNHLKRLFVSFYNTIHGDEEDFRCVKEIRNYFQDCIYESRERKYPSNYWTVNQQSSIEVLDKIVDMYQFQPGNFVALDKKIYRNNKSSYVSTNTLTMSIPKYYWELDQKITVEVEERTIRFIGDVERLDEPFMPIDSQESFNTKQVEFIFTNPEMLFIDIKRFAYDPYSDQFVKNNNPIEILYQIGDLELVSIVVHSGKSLNSGHYICYYKCNSEWYLMDDLSGISKVVDITKEKRILRDSTILIYY